MLSPDLADLFRVEPRSPVQAVKRNPSRFPVDFIPPNREHGVLMLSSVLSSSRAIQVNIGIMRVFVRLREILSAHKEDLAVKLQDLERTQREQGSHIDAIWNAVQRLVAAPSPPKRLIGFSASAKKDAVA